MARGRAAAHPDKVSYVFLAEGDAETERLGYAQLDLRARAVAAELQARGAAGKRVLIAYPTGLQYIVAFLGCLYAGAVAVPCDAPQRRSGLDRLRLIAADAQPGFALAAATDDRAMSAVGGHRAVPALDVVDIPDESAAGWREPPPDPDTLALLQYTSGSTQNPRGVMVTHGNIMANERALAVALRHDADSVVVGWLPIFHDMGLIVNVLQPLYLGSLSVLMPPAALLQNPVRWLRAVTRYRAVTSGGPNFAYDMCAARIPPDDRVGLDLSGWRQAFNGAEMVRPATLRRFAHEFGRYGFRPEAFFPGYGLAEATLIVTGAPRGRPPRTVTADPVALRNGRIVEAAPDRCARSLTACGPAMEGTRVVIVDPQTGTQCPPGTLGEIWVAGPGVALGYWERPGATAETFHARLSGTGDGPFLRTGDIGAVVAGELVPAGRIKDLIVIRGQNIHPHDLEWTAESSHPALRPSCGVAFAIDVDDEEQLVIAYEIARGHQVDVEEVAGAIRTAVTAGHGVDVTAVALVQRAGLPKTTSGKIRRSACREAFVAGRLPLLGVSWAALRAGGGFAGLPDPGQLAALDPADGTAALAASILYAAAARNGIPAGALRVSDPVSTLALDSLAAAELQHALQDRYAVTLPPVALLSERSFEEIASQVCTRLWATSADPPGRR